MNSSFFQRWSLKSKMTLWGGFNHLLDVLAQREQALRDSESRFQSLAAMSSDFYWETDAGHRFSSGGLSDRHANVAVFKSGRQMGLCRWEIPHLTPDEAGWKAHRAMLDAHLPFREFEISRLDDDGIVRHFLISGDPLFDAAGTFKGYRGIGKDVTERRQLEAAQQESEQRFRGLIEWSPESHIVHRGGTILYVNPAAIAMFGANTEQELVGKSLLDRVHPDCRSLVLARRKQVLESNQAVPLVEMKFLRLDGSPIDTEIQTLPVNFNGAAAIHSVARDVSSRKQAEDMAYKTARRLRLTLDHSWICVWENDLRSNEVWLSAAWAAFLGNPAADTCTSSSAVRALVHPEDRERAGAAVIRILKGGSASCELRVRAASGEWRWIRSHGQVIERDASGRAVYLSGTNIDITEQLRAEQTQARLAAIVENSNDAIFSRALDGTILSWNAGAEKLLGFSAAQAIGKSISITLPPDLSSTLESNNEAMLRGEAVVRDTERLTRDGRIISVRSSHSPIRDRAGNLVAISVILQDTREHKRSEAARASLEAQLREVQKMEAIGTLAGGIAHDFNNIITTILGNTDLAREDSRGNPRALESLGEIRKAGARARDLVRQILSFSRRQATERKRITLEPVVEETLRLLRATLPARIALTAHCEPGVPMVLADATQIEQALINLVTNAMQALGSVPGNVAIRLDSVDLDATLSVARPVLRELWHKHPGLTVRLSIKDDGPGMNRATLERVFEPFFTTKAVNKGTGLGLSVVHGIVQAHGGAIEVESEPGLGAIFTIYLPLARELEPQAGAAVTAEGEGSNASTRPAATPTGEEQHILYIDDDEALVHLVQRLLRRQGFRVTGHTDQREALRELRANPAAFDLVLSDYNMPGMSGLDVAREVRSIRADLPVAIASGFIDETLRAEAGEAGVRELIFKAEAVESFCAVVQRLALAVGSTDSTETDCSSG